MNKILNDNKEYVYAVGQEGSIARIKAQYPNAIKLGNKLFWSGSYSRLGQLSAMADFRKELELDEIPRDHINTIIKVTDFCTYGKLE
jgi:hypothetical protein